jgi:hypothetical protein
MPASQLCGWRATAKRVALGFKKKADLEISCLILMKSSKETNQRVRKVKKQRPKKGGEGFEEDGTGKEKTVLKVKKRGG